MKKILYHARSILAAVVCVSVFLFQHAEVYANDQAYDNHVQTPHYEEYIVETDGMVERRDVKTLVRDVLATQGAIVLD